MPNKTTNEKQSGEKNVLCPECQGRQVVISLETETFRYGAGDEEAELTCHVPVRKCQRCGFQFTEADAEDIRHAAICKHLGVMNPGEVGSIRKRYGLTREEFAKVTRQGEASLSRWENGYLIQNAANDQLLYLLLYPENMERLKARIFSEVPVVQPDKSRSDDRLDKIKKVFRASVFTSADFAAADAFSLRPAHA